LHRRFVMKQTRLNRVAGRMYIVLAAMLCTSCPYFQGSMPVQVLLPEFPEVWAGADAWELEWQSREILYGPILFAPGAMVSLLLPRGDEASLLCRAVFGTRRTLPYGAVWPQGLQEDGVLIPDAAGGYAASLAVIFYRAGFSECGFDLNRFSSEAENRMADPWVLDPASLVHLVAGHTFRVDYLKATDTQTAFLAGIPAVLAPASPWGKLAVPDASGTAIVELSPGCTGRWLSALYEVSAELSESEGLVWTFSALPDQRGTRMEKVLPAPSRLCTEASPP